MKRVVHIFCFLFLFFGMSSCIKQYSILEADQSQVALRQIQSRRFDTGDKTKVMRATIATLQDLGFIIEKADEGLGTISAVKRSGYTLMMTISVRTFGESQTIVRANAQLNLRQVKDPEPYQNLFSALSKSLFLQANAVD
jgi:hypothetical protein